MNFFNAHYYKVNYTVLNNDNNSTILMEKYGR